MYKIFQFLGKPKKLNLRKNFTPTSFLEIFDNLHHRLCFYILIYSACVYVCAHVHTHALVPH